MREKKPKANPRKYQDMAVSILLDSYTALDVDEVIEEYQTLEEEGTVDIPDELVQKCRQRVYRALAKERTKKVLANVTKATAKAAMFLLMLIGLTTVTALSVEAIRVPLISFLVETFDDHTSIQIQDETNEENTIREEVFRRLEQVLPEGYSCEKKKCDVDGSLYVRYIDQNGGIIVLQTYTDRGVVNIDSDESGLCTMELNGNQAIYGKKDGQRLVWTDEANHVVFDLLANNLSEDMFWVIAEYISK